MSQNDDHAAMAGRDANQAGYYLSELTRNNEVSSSTANQSSKVPPTGGTLVQDKCAKSVTQQGRIVPSSDWKTEPSLDAFSYSSSNATSGFPGHGESGDSPESSSSNAHCTIASNHQSSSGYGEYTFVL